jgi:hypothetical protein
MSDDDSAEPLAHGRYLRGVVKRNPASSGIGCLAIFIVGAMFIAGLTNPDKRELVWIAPIVLFAVFVPLIIRIVILLRYAPLEAEATDEGLVWRDRNGEHSRRWSEVREIHRIDKRDDNNAEGKTTVVFDDDERVVLDQTLRDYEELASEVQTRAAEAMMSRALEEVEKKPVEFGPVTVRRDGVVVNTHYFPWEKVESFTVFLGNLNFKIVADREWYESVKLHEIPNYAVVLNLLNHFGVRFEPARIPGMKD